jgi:hypothetical protein
MVTAPKLDPRVVQAFEAFPAEIWPKLLALRQLILEVARSTDGVGPVTEMLKWGEPAYLTEESRSGSTIRIGWKATAATRYTLYFNCRTTLVDGFRSLFPDELRFQGNRAIIFEATDSPPKAVLSQCIAMALTYHLKKPTGVGR